MSDKNDSHAQGAKDQISAIVLSAILGKADGETYGASHARKMNEERAEKAAERILALRAPATSEPVQCSSASRDPVEQLHAALADIEISAYNAAKLRIGWALEALGQPASRSPAEGERQRCMEILEDVPGETLVDRVNRLKDWHQELSNSYHDAIAEARTERDQSIALVEKAEAWNRGRAEDIMTLGQEIGQLTNLLHELYEFVAPLNDFRPDSSLGRRVRAALTSTVGGSDGAA